MTKNYVTQEQLNEKLKDIKVDGFSHYSGKVLNGLAQVAVIAGALTYGAMTSAYGPYDTGKVIYAELSGDKSLKHRHVETAKALYARRIQKQELDEKDMRNLFIELRTVTAEDKKPAEDDISWYALLDWIEDNN